MEPKNTFFYRAPVKTALCVPQSDLGNVVLMKSHLRHFLSSIKLCAVITPQQNKEDPVAHTVLLHPM